MSLLYTLFGIKSRKELKRDIGYLENMVNITKYISNNRQKRNDWHESVINKVVFNNNFQDNFEHEVRYLSPEQVSEENLDQNNATLYCGDDNKYLYLSKKLTEDYKYLSINYRENNLRFILNNDQIGIEIDTNNRVKDKETILYLKEYFGFENKKIEIIFEKI